VKTLKLILIVAQCKYNSASTSPGNCKCGKPMKWEQDVIHDIRDLIFCQIILKSRHGAKSSPTYFFLMAMI
jgi:hypothetical protein